jgi:hypothetical protein
VSRQKGAGRWITFIGYLFMVIGAFCLFLRYAFPGPSDRLRWAETAWGLLIFGVGFLVAGGILVLANEGWARMVRMDESQQDRRRDLPR